MSEWKEEFLYEIVDIRVSNVDKKVYPNKFLVKLCNYMDAYSNDYISSKISFSIGSADLNEIQRFGLKTDDVIITKDSEKPDDIAIPAVVIENIANLVCGYHLAILRPNKEQIDGKYLMFKLKTNELKSYFGGAAKGSTRFGLTIGDIEKALISFPTLLEQRKIAQILSTADIVIEKTQAAIAKYKVIKQGMLHDLFTRGIDLKAGKLRPRYEYAPELYKESKLGWVPKEWEVERIDKLAKITTGNKDTQNKETFGKYPFFVRSQTIENISTYSYDSEAILTSGDGVGVGKIFHYINGKFDFHQRVYMLFEFEKTVIPKFLFYFFSNNFLSEVDRYSAKTTVDSVRMEMIAGMNIPLPKILEQEKIKEKLIILENKLQTEQDYLYKLQEIKSGLMGDLLSGKRKVNVEKFLTEATP